MTAGESASPYARVGAKLVDSGYSAVPCLPGQKRPGAYRDKRWVGDMDWQRFCSRIPTEIEVRVWNGWPDAGVSLALGGEHNVAAIDVDADAIDIVIALETMFADIGVADAPRKKGEKGFTLIVRAAAGVTSKPFNIRGADGENVRVLDLLCAGRHTVLPPSHHPAGMLYEWLGDDIEHLAPEHLPVLPDDIVERIESVLAPFGYQPQVEVERPVGGCLASGEWSDINGLALRYLDAWVPDLGVGAKRQRNGTWRSAAVWRHGDNETSVSYHPQGIKDFREDQGYSAVDVVMASFGCENYEALDWLRDQLGLDLPRLQFEFRKGDEPEQEALAPTRPAARASENSEGTTTAPDGTPGSPFESAGGLLQRVAEWILSASIIPCPELALLAAIGAMTAFMGRRYVGPTGLAPNLYLVGLAKTGSGKNAPLSAARRLLLGSRLVGGDDLASDAAIEKTVRQQPVCLCPMDEVGAWLQEGSARMAQGHVKGRRKMLLSLYSVSEEGGIFMGRDRAGDEIRSSTQPVFSPCFSIFGVSTEALFFKGITEENTVDGFMNRLTIVRIPEVDEPDELPEVNRDVPSELQLAMDEALEAWSVKDALARHAYKSALVKPTMHRVPWADAEAKHAYTAVRRAQKAMIKADPDNEGLYKRRGEQALKIAMIRAVSRDFAAPAIIAEDVRYGDAIAARSCEMLAAGIRENMSGSDFEANWKLLLKHVNDADDNGLTATKLSAKPGVSKIEPRKFDEAVKFLNRTGKWEAREHPKKKGQYRYIKLGDRVVEEEE